MPGGNRTGRPTGRPTKKTPKLCKALFEGIRAGWPYVVACQSVGISHDVFQLWRRTDERFAKEVNQAEAEAIKANLETIKKASRDQWPAAAWLLERRRPDLFSRPEVQLNLIQQNTVNANGNGDGSFQMVVVSDLEYLGLREHESYQHHADQAVVRDIEAERVSPELSGHLSKDGVARAVVISESQAQEIERRVAESDARVEEFFNRKNGEKTDVAEPVAEAAKPESQTTSPSITPLTYKPGDEASKAFWRYFAEGSDEKPVERECAVTVCRLILTDLVGAAGANNAKIDFERDPVTVGDVLAKLEDATGGPGGWRVILRRAGFNG